MLLLVYTITKEILTHLKYKKYKYKNIRNIKYKKWQEKTLFQKKRSFTSVSRSINPSRDLPAPWSSLFIGANEA